MKTFDDEDVVVGGPDWGTDQIAADYEHNVSDLKNNHQSHAGKRQVKSRSISNLIQIN